MKRQRHLAVFLFLSSTVFAADKRPEIEDSINVTVVGTLRTGIIAIGGETTGTTITAKGITWELDLGKKAEIRQAAEMLTGKKVIVRGSLERRKGVEVQQRWIVSVTGLQVTDGEIFKSPNGKIYPSHWGAPPRAQTRDLRNLPGGFGRGSGTLAKWIQENLNRDTERKGDD
ncbi:MAG: hypothetical protein HKN47_04335 [Pirellulaceae bacterium]|nr:hypothetical protein [Pirellulaceae bacterium]